MLIIGLSGGVASGKNFVASCLQNLKKLKIAVFDADLEVHNLLKYDQKILLEIAHNFPAVVVNGVIDRAKLAEQVFVNKAKLLILEKIIYPKLKAKESRFIQKCRSTAKKIALLNIPLLFEKGGYKNCHKTILVVASKKVRFFRFKSRFQFEPEAIIAKKFANIVKNQANNLKKQHLADFIIYNGLNKAFTVKQIKNLPFLIR